MARTLLPNTDLHLAQRLLDLQACPLFGDLSLEQLQLLARACMARTVSQSEARRPLADLAGQVVIVAEGRYESIYLADDKAREQPDLALELQRIGPGELWGEHHLASTDPARVACLGLRAASHGRLLMLPALRLRHYIGLWPELGAALFALVSERALDRLLEVARLRDIQAGSDLVLDRIDSVAEVLLSGDQASDTHQRKYLLKEMPALKNMVSTEQLEQGYLEGSKTREDRFRCRCDLLPTDPLRYQRTSRFGAGISRREFTRRISAEEYQRLQRLSTGHLIRKQRYVLDADSDTVKLRLDEFSGAGNLAGLLLLEAEFGSAEQAEAFKLPAWLEKAIAKEVTDEPAYGNRSLALYGKPDI